MNAPRAPPPKKMPVPTSPSAKAQTLATALKIPKIALILPMNAPED
jgi:hypothetical protein